MHNQIREEVGFNKGRIIVRGKLHIRAEQKRADYILYYKSSISLAVIEAKDNSHSVGAGMQQALNYAETLPVLRLLPVIITAMTLELVKADVAQAEDTGVLVLTKENLEQIFNELLRFPNADNLFEQGMQKVINNSKKTKDLFPQFN